jgi:hypothetical protein
MKRSILSLFAMVAALVLNAQAIDSADSEKAAPSFSPSFAVKWNPSSIVFGKVSLFGEYNFKNRRSLTFNAGIPVETATYWNIEDESRKITMKSYSVMAGYRMYLGKHNMKGLYFEPYLKYMGSKGSFPYMDTKSVDSTIYLLSSNYRGGGVGAQLGVQFLIVKKITLDFFLLGPEANLSKWDIDLQEKGDYSWDTQDAQEALDILNDIVDDLPNFISDNVKTSVDAPSKTVRAKYNGFLPGLRMGVSVGIRF